MDSMSIFLHWLAGKIPVLCSCVCVWYL